MPFVRGECNAAQCPLLPVPQQDQQAPQIPRQAWADGYWQQSRSDFDIFNKLSDVPECHRLHYLQMACEKIAKAYRLRDTSASLDGVLNSHVAFSKFVEPFLGSAEIKKRYQGRISQLRTITRLAKKLAREIEKLAPAVDRDRSPANAEYPWEEEGRVVVPCSYQYSSLTLLKQPAGRNFVKLIEIAIEEFEEITLS